MISDYLINFFNYSRVIITQQLMKENLLPYIFILQQFYYLRLYIVKTLTLATYLEDIFFCDNSLRYPSPVCFLWVSGRTVLWLSGTTDSDNPRSKPSNSCQQRRVQSKLTEGIRELGWWIPKAAIQNLTTRKDDERKQDDQRSNCLKKKKKNL